MVDKGTTPLEFKPQADSTETVARLDVQAQTRAATAAAPVMQKTDLPQAREAYNHDPTKFMQMAAKGETALRAYIIEIHQPPFKDLIMFERKLDEWLQQNYQALRKVSDDTNREVARIAVLDAKIPEERRAALAWGRRKETEAVSRGNAQEGDLLKDITNEARRRGWSQKQFDELFNLAKQVGYSTEAIKQSQAPAASALQSTLMKQMIMPNIMRLAELNRQMLAQPGDEELKKEYSKTKDKLTEQVGQENANKLENMVKDRAEPETIEVVLTEMLNESGAAMPKSPAPKSKK